MLLLLCVQVVIPDQCLLNPSPEAAVVGGNVLTSQRVTDVVLKAFGAAAASQVKTGHTQYAALGGKESLVSVFYCGIQQWPALPALN